MNGPDTSGRMSWRWNEREIPKASKAPPVRNQTLTRACPADAQHRRWKQHRAHWKRVWQDHEVDNLCHLALKSDGLHRVRHCGAGRHELSPYTRTVWTHLVFLLSFATSVMSGQVGPWVFTIYNREYSTSLRDLYTLKESTDCTGTSLVSLEVRPTVRFVWTMKGKSIVSAILEFDGFQILNWKLEWWEIRLMPDEISWKGDSEGILLFDRRRRIEHTIQFCSISIFGRPPLFRTPFYWPIFYFQNN